MIIKIFNNSLILNTDSVQSAVNQLLNSYFKPTQQFKFDGVNGRISILGLEGDVTIKDDNPNQ